MRQTWILTAFLFAACVEAGPDPDTDTLEAPLQSQVFYEKFDGLALGHLDAQNGWTSTGCQVFPDGASANKYAKCQDGAGAWKSTDEPGNAGTYHLLADLWPNVNVTASTHAKLSLEGPQGRAIQIIVGCDNLRVAFQMGGPVATLRTFPCGGTGRAPTRYRVLCTWSTGGLVLRCGSSVLPADPLPGDYVDLALPWPGMRPFDQVQLTTYPGLPGATLFDKLHIARD